MLSVEWISEDVCPKINGSNCIFIKYCMNIKNREIFEKGRLD